MTIYAQIDPVNRRILQTLGRLSDPPAPPPSDQYLYQELLAPISFAEPYTGAILKWIDGSDSPEWVDTRTIDEARVNKTAEMSAACSAAILAGFKSSALGIEYLYPAKMTDQTNLAGSVLDSLLPGPADWTTPFWCADAVGAWEFRMHSAAQIQQVGRDAKIAILAAMSHNEALREQIEVATLAQLDTIVWAP